MREVVVFIVNPVALVDTYKSPRIEGAVELNGNNTTSDADTYPVP